MEAPRAAGWLDTSAAELHELAQRHGTPYFLYDADAVGGRIDLVRDAFQSQVKVFYAVKSNPNLALLRALRGIADGLDISSAGELEQAALAGYAMADLSFAGPAKSAAELTAAIDRGVGGISIESLRELRECVQIARGRGVRACIVLRVNPQRLNRAFGMKMGGRAVQFGIDEEHLGGAVAAIRDHGDCLDFRGLHVYAGSQCFEAAGVAESVADSLRIARQIEAGGLICRTVNLGGGFGVAHGADHRELDVAALAEQVLPLLRAWRGGSGVEREVIFELGRFLTAAAGIYVTRVISSKESRGKHFFMVDGGLHHHLAAAGTFGTALRSNYVLQNLSRPDAPAVRCHVAGPSCNPTDLLGIDVELPRPEPDDLIGVLKSGSYGFTASPLLFLGRQTPAELVRRQGRVVLGRRPRTMADFN